VKKEIEDYFKEYQRCRDKWGILPEDTYNSMRLVVKLGCLLATQLSYQKELQLRMLMILGKES
jgi:hypothetical protein